MTDEATTTTVSPPAYDPLPELTPFEGADVKGIITKYKGVTESIHREIHGGEEWYGIVRGKGGDITHKPTKDGLKRVQVQNVEIVMIDSERGRELLSTERQAALKRGELVGQLEIGDTSDAGGGVTDGSGVALTPDEVAEAQGRAPAGGAGEPWLGYDKQRAPQVIAAIDLVESVDQLQAAADYERRGKKRSPIIKAAEARIAELEAAER